MIECTIEQSSLTLRWAFPDRFVSIPEPGDENFMALYRGLHQYEVQLSSISIERSNRNLADNALVIPLFNGRIRLRLGHAGIELEASELIDDDESQLAEISKLLLLLIYRPDRTTERVIAAVSWQGFLRLQAVSPDDILRQHLHSREELPDLIPNAFSYRVRLGTEEESPVTRVVVARSVTQGFMSDLFLELNTEYSSPGEADEFAKRAEEDFYHVLQRLGFKVNK